ncbi:uncharacterized protein LOC131491349 [Neofelis nebulosa]|uniref:uncharacterized protein LOC131491349 n=1 Tax=Neofelis nebulosa TaxID=61452 RepID=UPI00272B7521|nr:uncharacterized protein LOC131491349 [Neofelis nebulosa]
MPNYRVLLVVGASGKQKTARKRERAVEKVAHNPYAPSTRHRLVGGQDPRQDPSPHLRPSPPSPARVCTAQGLAPWSSRRSERAPAGRSLSATGTLTNFHRHLHSDPGLFPVTFGASPQTLGWRGVSWRCAWASTATRGSCTRNCSLRSDTGLGPSLPSDRCHPRLHGSGPTLGGSLAREPDPQDTFGKALAACTCRELRSGALGTRYRPPNRRPQARVTLVSVSPVELRTSRAGANWVLRPPGSAFTWRTWLTSTHLYCSPTGLDSRGLETQRRMELVRHRKVWYRLAGRVHASPARVFQSGVAGDVGRLQAGGCEHRGVGRAQAGSGFSEGRGESECLGPPAPR